MQKFKTSGTEFEKLATHVSGVVLSPSCFVFLLRKQRKLPAMRKAMTIKPPGTLKCPRLPLPTSQSISVSVAATTCQQCQGYHHQQSSYGRTVGVPICSKHKLPKTSSLSGEDKEQERCL